MAFVLVLVLPPTGGREKGTSHLAYVFDSSCLRTERGKVWRPYSFPVSEPVRRAGWKTLGLAMEDRMERQRGELGVVAPTKYGLTCPFNTDIGQKAKVRLAFRVSSLMADFRVIVAFPYVKEGRSQRGGRKPSRDSSGVLRSRAESHGVCP